MKKILFLAIMAFAGCIAVQAVDGGIDQPAKKSAVKKTPKKKKAVKKQANTSREEVIETVQVTQIAIVDEVKNEMLVQDSYQESQVSYGVVNEEGDYDVDRFHEVKEQVKVVEEPKPEPPMKAKGDQIFTAVEEQATFPGGQAALMKWLSANIIYPEAAQENNIQGRVIVRFVVETDGSITNANILKGVDKDLDREALRVVIQMPKWQPGKNNGEAVRSYFTLPVTFKLQSEEPKVEEGN